MVFHRVSILPPFMALLAGLLPGVAAGEETRPFHIGMLAAGADPAAIEGLGEIRAAFSTALAMPVEVLVARDYAALMEAQIAGRIDYAIYTAAAYAAAQSRCECLLPLAAPVDADGAVGFRSVLILRSGPDDAAPPVIAVGPPDSLAGRLVPLAAWPGAQDAVGSGRLVATEGASAALALFAEGEVDGLFGWLPASLDEELPSGGTLERLEAAGIAGGAYEIAWRSDLLRYGPHAVRADLPEDRVAALSQLLATLGSNPDLHYLLTRRYGGGLSPVTPEDYAPVMEALSAIGRDIASAAPE
jgi:phosphonate transport system substrate-binding protein